MISSGLMLLATMLCVAILVPFTAATPLTVRPTEIELKKHCSVNLAETIDFVCNGRTRSLMDNYPGARGKRLAPQEVFYRPLQNGSIHICCSRPCGYPELKEYCAPD